MSLSTVSAQTNAARRTTAQPRTTARARSTAPLPNRRIVAPELRIADNPAAAVLRVAAQRGPVSRDVAARATGSSIATVNRQVSALVGVGLLRERTDLTAAGAVGRPRVPFEVDHERFCTVGIHMGAVVTSITVSDLRGKILGSVEISTPHTAQSAALAAIGRSADAFASRWHRRTPLWCGVAIGGRVDVATGTVDHPRLGWTDAPVGNAMADALGLQVSVSGHVEAMAAAELLLSPRPAVEPVPGHTSLYFYAREMAGVALTIDNRVHVPATGPGSIAHVPTGSTYRCDCGNVGCLEATISDRAVIKEAIARGIIGDPKAVMADVYQVAKAGNAQAHELLVERAETLGRTAAMLRDMFNPDVVILGGQAFTEYPLALGRVSDAFTRTSTFDRKDLRVTGFGNRVQQCAATAVSLSALYSDPIGAMRKAAPSAVGSTAIAR